MTMSSVSRRLSHPLRARRTELNAMAGPSESVLMAKVRSPHLLPFAQENSRRRDGLPVSMCGPRIERLCATIRPAAARKLDSEDIEFDIYMRARELMELSGLRLLPEQDIEVGGLYLW